MKLISEEAARWFLLFSEGQASVQLQRRREFCAWLRRSPENIAAILAIAGINRRLKRTTLELNHTQPASANVLRFPELIATSSAQVTTPSEQPPNAASQMRRIAQMAAIALICVAIVLASTMKWPSRSELSLAQVVETEARQVRHVTLSDGSIAHLASQTRMDVAFSGTQRLIHLFEGSAVFEVAKDRKRPFIVRTHLIDATAVGTRFGVSLEEGVTTTVSEGVVTVRSRDEKTANQLRLIAGQSLHSRSGMESSSAIASVDAIRELAWASGWLVFRGETVSEAAAAFNRFNATQIVIDDPNIGKRTLGSYRFRIYEPVQFAQAIAASPEVKLIVDEPNDVLRLEAE